MATWSLACSAMRSASSSDSGRAPSAVVDTVDAVAGVGAGCPGGGRGAVPCCAASGAAQTIAASSAAREIMLVSVT